MSATLPWTNCLSAPRSLGTGSDIAIAAVEDPGVLDLQAASEDVEALLPWAKGLGQALPSEPWTGLMLDAETRIIWRGPARWMIALPRVRAAEVAAHLRGAAGASAAVVDQTGGFAALKIVGSGAGEVLARTCPLDLQGVPDHHARGTSIGGCAALLLKEGSSPPSWLTLVGRSYAEHAARILVEAAASPHRLNLFAPAGPPAV